MTIHIHAGGGDALCGSRTGTVVNDADEATCVDCIKRVRDYIYKRPNSPYVKEVERACKNVGLEFVLPQVKES